MAQYWLILFADMLPKKPRRVAPLSVIKVNLLPIAKRLARMEAIILEMRFEQEAGLAKLQRQVDRLTERRDAKVRSARKKVAR